MSSLQMGGMDGRGGNHLGCGDAFHLAAPLAVDIHGIVDAFRAAGGDRAGFLVETIYLAHLFAVQHPAHHGQHFGLELGAARAQVALQDVDVGEHIEDLVQEGIVFHAAVVHGTGTLPALPFLIFFIRHVGDLFQDFFFIHTSFRQLGEDLEEFVVGMHIAKHIH